MTIRLDAHKPEFHRAAPPQLPVRVASTASVTISTALNAGDTIDGVTLAAGDRVLLKNQSTGSQNGIYIAGATPARAFDFEEGVAAYGAVIYVVAGTANGGHTFVCTNTTVPTIGTDPLTFSDYSPTSGGAPTTADYLVGTAQAGLSAEIVVGTTPGGELGGTWGSPTVDTTHSGSAHTDFIAKSLLTTQDDIIVRDGTGPARLAKGTDGQVLTVDPTTHHLVWATPSGGGAPTTVDYLVGTADGTLSNEIVVGTTPGGELGGTWASPTVDATHSGSTHSAATDTHIADTSDAHDASAISSAPFSTIAATDVQAALEEVFNEAIPGGTPAGLTYIRATADEDVTNAQNTDHSQFQFSVTAGKIYILQAYFLTSANNATADFEYSWTVTAGTMDGRGHSGQQDSTLTFAMTGIALVASATSGNVVVGTNAAGDLGFPGVAILNFAFRQNTSNGTFKFRFGNNSTGVGRTSRMMQGSYIAYRQTN